MFGLYYAILGLLSGAVCSFIANKQLANRKDWFTVGQILPLISILLIVFIIKNSRNKEAVQTKISDRRDQTITLAEMLV